MPSTTENDIFPAINQNSVFKSEKIEFGNSFQKTLSVGSEIITFSELSTRSNSGELSWGRGAVVSIRIPTAIPEEQLTTTSYDVTEDDKLIIVLSHNRIRSEADPPASNLRKLVWSEHLASQATTFIKKCSDFEGNRQGDNLRFSEGTFD